MVSFNFLAKVDGLLTIYVSLVIISSQRLTFSISISFCAECTCFMWLSDQAATVFIVIKQPTVCIYKACKIYLTITLSVSIPFDCHHKGVKTKFYVAKIIIKPFFI